MRRAAPAGTFSAWRSRCAGWRGWGALRYLLIWPLIGLYRDCVRRSLRWRLAESHVGTILFSVAAVSVIGAVASVASAFLQRPMEQEPANEAKWVAEGLQRLGWVDDLALVAVPRRVGAAVEVVDDRVLPVAGPAREAQTTTSALLAAMATGQVSPNPFTEDVNLMADRTIGKALANVSSISVVGPDQTVLASSEPILNGRSALLIGPAALGVARSALDGEESTAENTRIVEGLGSITGAHPVRGGDGRIVGAVVVDKSARTLPSGLGFAALVLEYVGELALRIALLIGIPAIPIGLLIGIRRARAIGRPITALAVAADAIAGRQLDARVPVEGDDELATLGRRFNQMAERLQESLGREAAARERAERLLAANRELIANVSHELRTPVALVRAHLESLAGEPERVDEYARIALRETERLDALVADLFQLARIEGQGVELAREPFDAAGAVREATESLVEPARREAGIVVRASVEFGVDDRPGALRCVGDRARLVQVLQGLVRNAIRFTPEGGIVLVGARPDGDAVELSVQDTGVGIAPKDLPHVFERFYRSEQSRNRTHGGAGLGLAIARRLIEGMGGAIAVESALGEGTRFAIRLPRPSTSSATNGTAPNPPRLPSPTHRAAAGAP